LIKFSPQFLEHLKEKIRLSDVIQRAVVLKKKGNEFLGLCPFHNEKTPSFTVNDQKHFYHCFGCGAHGTVFDYLINRENLNFPEAVEHVAQLAGVPLPTPSVQEKITQDLNKQKVLLDIMDRAAQWFESNLKKPEGRIAVHYLKERDISPATQAHFRLGYAPNRWDGLLEFFKTQSVDLPLLEQAGLVGITESKKPYDNFHHRVMFPITNKKGQVIGFGGRSLDGSEPKYLNTKETPIFHKGRVLYNFKEARSQKKEIPLIVAEGYMDVLALWQYGYSRAVAPLGTALTETHLEELWALHPNPILCFDGDAAGKRAELRAIQRALPLLRPGYSLSFISLPIGEDPDTYLKHEGSKGFNSFLENPTPLLECLFQREFEIHHPKTPEKRALFEKNLLNYISLIRDPYIQNHYKQALKELLYEWKGTLRTKKTSASKSAFSFSSRGAGEGTKRMLDTLAMREKIMLAIILTYPALLSQIFEEFSRMVFKNPCAEKIKESILGYFTQHFSLEKSALYSYLSDTNLKHEIDALFLADKVLVHAPFLKGDLDEKILKDYWDHMYGLHQREFLQLELHQLEQELVHDLSPEKWARYQAFKALLIKEIPESLG